ncbi:MAG: HisA/HisF-related TIM barrel protein [Thermodesulfovibrio sp.]|nr:HisA/HisF-related TIM barrel protein [Thermodesulfovibrio sp.]MDW7998291.1 HisA/HisF-related TIM barrel protein [Thermodesulfovibrio sp.]
MPYKRLIFILLHDSGKFVLSRNFRLQRVGDLNWLIKNYNFSTISYSIDELIVLDVTRQNRSIQSFSNILKAVIDNVFVPVCAGGGIESIDDARVLLNSGADKIVVNSLLYTDDKKIMELSKNFGRQCIVASIDFKLNDNGVYEVFYKNGQLSAGISLSEAIKKAINSGAGEILINSMDRDGTGYGYALEVLDGIDFEMEVPLIISGGAGKAEHLIEGLKNEMIDAVATANLLNFIGNGLPLARKKIIESGVELAHWNSDEFEKLKQLREK